MTAPSDPWLSVVIVAYDMAREAPRTVRSFLPPYQRGMTAGEVELIVMENGSSRPIPEDVRAEWPESVRYVRVEDARPSPVAALNQGAAMARGQWVGMAIDGARLASPGMLALVREARGMTGEPVVATIGLHLGAKPQQRAVKEGYDQAEEDRLLESIAWPEDGYRLFEISCFGMSATRGWLDGPAESNAIFMRKRHFDTLGGFDERFDIPGGGLANLDFFKRAVTHEASNYVMLLGEGTFHQHHGGVTTAKRAKDGAEDGKSAWEVYQDQYRALRGEPYARPARRPIFLGGLTEPAEKAFEIAMKKTRAHR